MEFLLDTHVVIWMIIDSKLLTEKPRLLIGNTENKCFVSIGSLWEMAIKVSLNRLEINKSFEQIFKIISDSGFEILPLTSSHILQLTQLPLYHKDPFDRMIIVQSKVEKLPIITK